MLASLAFSFLNFQIFYSLFMNKKCIWPQCAYFEGSSGLSKKVSQSFSDVLKMEEKQQPDSKNLNFRILILLFSQLPGATLRLLLGDTLQSSNSQLSSYTTFSFRVPQSFKTSCKSLILQLFFIGTDPTKWGKNRNSAKIDPTKWGKHRKRANCPNKQGQSQELCK